MWLWLWTLLVLKAASSSGPKSSSQQQQERWYFRTWCFGLWVLLPVGFGLFLFLLFLPGCYLILYPAAKVKAPHFEIGPYWSEPPPADIWSWRVYLSDTPLLVDDDGDLEQDDDNEMAATTSKIFPVPKAAAVAELVKEEKQGDAGSRSILLWKFSSSQAPSNMTESRSFVITTTENEEISDENDNNTFVQEFYDSLSQRTRKHNSETDEDTPMAPSTKSVVFFVLDFIQQSIASSYESFLSRFSRNDEDQTTTSTAPPEVIRISPESPLWQNLRHNGNNTLYLHVLLMRGKDPSEDYKDASKQKGRVVVLYLANECIVGSMSLIRAGLVRNDTADRENPDDDGEAASTAYWKSQVGIRVVNETAKYPLRSDDDQEVEAASAALALPIVKDKRSGRSRGRAKAYLPVLVPAPLGVSSYDSFTGVTNEHDFRLDDDNTTAVPLHLSLGGAVQPAGWRFWSLLRQHQQSLRQFDAMQDENDSIDKTMESKPEDVFHFVAYLNFADIATAGVLLFCLFLFQSLTFRQEMVFWESNKDLTGLSVCSLLVDLVHTAVLLWTATHSESANPSDSFVFFVTWTLGLWKCQRVLELHLVPRLDLMWSWWVLIVGGLEMFLFQVVWGVYHVKSKRLSLSFPPRRRPPFYSRTAAPQRDGRDSLGEQQQGGGGANPNEKKGGGSYDEQDTEALTMEMDQRATRSLCMDLFPTILLYHLYRFVFEEERDLANFLPSLISGAIFDLHLLMVFPQVLLNHHFRSVAHLPWRYLACRTLQTVSLDLLLWWTMMDFVDYEGFRAFLGVHSMVDYITLLIFVLQGCWYSFSSANKPQIVHDTKVKQE